ncbi:hypothetical protein [Candidatus Regiella insecticola]|uniref:hypothetical protein n=1 Tax=Candidatus Regiella insecticola TaxID=138073 RepID=UPI0002EF5BC4|nr:hypothetical protein [Candidatus Regiella insecticola]
MKTGFCTEMSLVLIWHQIKRLAEGEQITFTMRKISDHCWVEMKTKDNIDVQWHK